MEEELDNSENLYIRILRHCSKKDRFELQDIVKELGLSKEIETESPHPG